MRKTFVDILKNNKIDIKREYSRLYDAFYNAESYEFSIEEMINLDFDFIWFKGTCQSLNDFNEEYDIHFQKQPKDFSLDYLINFCEYIYNFIVPIRVNSCSQFHNLAYDKIENHVLKLAEKLCLKFITKENYFILIQESPQAQLVAENVSDELSYKILEYNHHSLKGHLDAKKSILLKVAEELEPQRKELRKLDSKLETEIFFAFNNFNIRHNNCNPKNKAKYISQFAELDNQQKEQLYDWIYKQCLIGFIKLEKAIDDKIFNDIKEKISGKQL